MTDRLPMEINVRETAGVPVLEVHGRLTIGEPAEQLHDALESVVKGGAKRVVVVLNGIPQIDSSGISTLVRISIKLEMPELSICGMPFRTTTTLFAPPLTTDS